MNPQMSRRTAAKCRPASNLSFPITASSSAPRAAWLGSV
jgi:hypothetical protein